MKEINYYILTPEKFRLDGGAMYGIIPKPLWEKKSPPDDQNRIDLALRLMIIKSQNRVILIDTGIGGHYHEKFLDRFHVQAAANSLSMALKSIELTHLDITDIILSHLHFDHIGGLTNHNKCLFPNAKLHIHKKHYDYACSPTPRDCGSFIKKDFIPSIERYERDKRVHWVTMEKGIIISLPTGDIQYTCSHGHTPFMMHPFDSHFIYMADLVPTSNHVPSPWVMGYDIAPGQTTLDKLNIYPMIEKNKLKMIFEHDPLYYGATLAKNENGVFQINKLYKDPQQVVFKL